MHLNTEALPPQPSQKLCWRCLHELTTHHLPCQLVKLMPLDELRRRAGKLHVAHPRFAEELPLVITHEVRRRVRYRGLQVAGKPVRQYAHATEAYHHA